MNIQTVQTDFYRIALPVALTDSRHGEMKDFELITVRVRDSDGAEGVGYTYTPGSGASGAVALIRDDLTPQLIGQDADRIEHLWHRLWWHVHYAGRGGSMSFAISAIDIALWDLKAKRAGTPLWKLLGGFDPKVPCYAGGIDLYFPIDQLLAQTDGNLRKGFRAIKMKVGRPLLREDVERVRAMREHLGEGFPLMVDANMGWSVDQAIAAARAFAPYQLTWIEEPTIPDDIDGHARIVAAGGAPIAAGENLHSIYEFKQYIARGALSFVEPDVTNCGGVTAFIKIAHLAESFNLPVTSHGAHDVTVHLLAALPNRSYLEAHGFGLERYIARPLKIDNGFAMAPDEPGHGIAFDWPGLERLKVS